LSKPDPPCRLAAAPRVDQQHGVDGGPDGPAGRQLVRLVRARWPATNRGTVLTGGRGLAGAAAPALSGSRLRRQPGSLFP
jgi:hypothetical protein